MTLFSKTYGAMIGGASFILQPAMIALGVPANLAVAHDISGTNGSSISSIYVFSRSGHIQYKIFLYALPGLLIGPLFGVWTLSMVPVEIIEKFIATVSCLGAAYLLFRHKKPDGLVERPLPKHWKFITFCSGFLIGFYIGFSGAGAGVISGLILISFLGLTMTQTIATKRIVHAVPLFISALGHLWIGWLQWDLFLAVFAGCLGGGYLGSHITLRLNENILKFIFLVAAALMAGFILMR